jgi:hypothetical protein
MVSGSELPGGNRTKKLLLNLSGSREQGIGLLIARNE